MTSSDGTPAEPTIDDAPAGYDNSEAYAWLSGHESGRDSLAPVLEGLRAELEQLKEQKGAGWNAALDGSNHAAGLAAQIDRQRETIARLTREHDQAVKDWGRNDEQVLADSQRLADENADLRAKVERLTGYLSSIGGTIDAWEITDVSRPSVSDPA